MSADVTTGSVGREGIATPPGGTHATPEPGDLSPRREGESLEAFFTRSIWYIARREGEISQEIRQINRDLGKLRRVFMAGTAVGAFYVLGEHEQAKSALVTLAQVLVGFVGL